MKLNALKSVFTTWIPIENFPSFRELEKECKKYYNDTLIFCFASKRKNLYTIEFRYNKYIDKKNPGLEGFDLTYGYFRYTRNGNDVYEIMSQTQYDNRDFWFMDKKLKKYNFTKNINNNFEKYKINFDDELKYFCHVSKLADLITASIP